MFTHTKARRSLLQPHQSSIDSAPGDAEHSRGGYNQLQGTYTGSYSGGTRSVSSHVLLDVQPPDSPPNLSAYPKSNLCHLRQAGQLFLKCLHEENYSVLRLLLDDFKICLPTSPDGKFRDDDCSDLSRRRRASLQSGPVADYETARTMCLFKNILHIAIAHQNHDVVELLLNVGCDPNTRSSCECRPFRSAYKREARTNNYHNRSGICLSFSCRCLTETGHHFLDQSPLELAIAFRDVHLLTMLTKHGADIAAVDNKGNSPLLRVVRQSPLCWEAVECLLLLGARIHQRNADSVCPLDLLPEVARFQHFCIEECVRIAVESNDAHQDCNSPKITPTIGIGSLLQVWRAGHTALQYQQSHPSCHPSMSPRHSKVLQSIVMPDVSSMGSDKSLATPAASSSQQPTYYGTQRRSLIPGQLHQKFRNDRESAESPNPKSMLNSVVVEDVWEALLNMATNSECVMALEATILKSCEQLSKGDNDDAQDYPVDKNLGKLLQTIIMTAMSNFESNTISIKEKKELLVGSLSPLTTICLQLLKSGRQKVQYTAVLTLNKLVDTGIKLDLFDWPQYEVLSSVFRADNDLFSGSDNLTLVAPRIAYNQQNTRDQVKQARKFYSLNLNQEHELPDSIYSDEGLSVDQVESEFYLAFKQIEPTTVITMLHNCVTLSKRSVLTRSKCSPAHRWRQCQHHCAAVLCSRLLLFLCHMTEFSSALNNEQILKVLVNLLDVGLDSQILCFILQSIALLAMNPSCHTLIQDLQLEDFLIQLLLPADDWFYTNHTTMYGQYVKHHAARVLVYLGLGDRVGSRVNLFQFIGDNGVIKQGNCDEDNYVCDICGPQTMINLPGHSTYHTLETLLNHIIVEIQNELEAVEEEFLRRQSTISSTSLTIPNTNPQPNIFTLDTNPTSPTQWYTSGPLTSTNVETYLTQLTSFIDPVIFLRILLHKLSWDVGLIQRPKKTGPESGASSLSHQVVSAENSIAAGCNQERKWSCISDPTSNSYIKPGVGKSASFSIPPEPGSTSSSAPKLSSKRDIAVALRKSSSLKHIFSTRPQKGKSDSLFLHKNLHRTQSGGNAKISRSSCSKLVMDGYSPAHLPKYIQHLFRRRTGSAPKQGGRRHGHYHGHHRPRVDTDGSVSSADSEAIYEFQRRLQNYPVSRRPPVKQRSIANQSNCSSESRNSRSMQGSPIPEHCVGSDKSTSFLVAALVEQGQIGFPKFDQPHVIPVAPTTDHSELPYCGSPRMTARGSIIEPAVTVPQLTAGKTNLTLPAIEVRRPSTFSQAPSPTHQPFSMDIGSLQPLVSPSNDSGHSMPLPSPPFDGPPRHGSSFSTRSSGCSLILVTSNRSSRGPSVGSCESGPFLFSFRMRRRSVTFGSPTSNLPTVPAASPIDGRTPTKALTAELHILRHLLLVCLKTRGRTNSSLIAGMKETGDLLRQILNVSNDSGVHQWCAEIINVVASQGMDEEVGDEVDEKLNDEYLEAQELIVSGNLPVPREDAAQLASIQICIEENWPENRRKQIIRKHLMKGQFGRAREMANKIMVTPWELDQSLFCTPPRKPAVPKKHRSFLGGDHSSSAPSVHEASQRSPKNLLAACFLESAEGQLSAEIQEQCIPPSFRADRRTLKLIKEKKRKLFHSRVFESEVGMKNLYVQTCRKLPAWGCRVFQVKELVHGHAFKKNIRLLCMSPQTICLLDAETKLAMRQAETAHLQQWRVGGGLSKHQVLLEFRSAKWHFVVPSRSGLKGISMTLWEVLQNDINIHHSLKFCRPQQHLNGLFAKVGVWSRDK